MRQIGTIADENRARTLADYLLTEGISTRLDHSPGGWIVWVHREEFVDRAREELAQFQADPDAPRYAGAETAAKAKRREAEILERKHRRNTVDLSGRWSYRPSGRMPVTLLLIGLSVAAYITTEQAKNVAATQPLRISPETIVIDADGGLVEQQSLGLRPIAEGQVWRLVTPIFIHFSFLHILFNMMWLYDLGGLIELRRGSLRMLGLVLGVAVVSNFAEFAWSEFRFSNFGGMSGVVYGLLGYVWMKARFGPSSGMYLRQQTVTMMLIWLVVCMTGMLGGIANVAHLVGLVVGMAIGYVPTALARFGR